MKWHAVAENWSQFYDAIMEKWPEASEEALDDIDGEQADFVAYIADLMGVEPSDAREEVIEWLANELPADLLLESYDDDNDMSDEE